MTTKGKLVYLEGMRALMALNVIICHLVCVYYPQMYFAEYNGPLSYFATTPLSALVNGNVAVVFFFALTGFLVGKSVFLKDVDVNSIRKKAANRYLRLMPVVVIATVFTFATMKLGLQYHLDITNENVNLNFLSAYCNFDVSIGNLVSNSLFWPFVDYSAYIGPFWTISYELWGYVIVFLMAYTLKDSKYRRIAYFVIMAVMLVCLDSYYCVFVMGLLIADLAFNSKPTVFGKAYSYLLKHKAVVSVLFFIASYFACCPMQGNSSLYSFWYKLPLVNHILLRGFGISLFLWVVVNSKILQKVFSIKPLVFLGEMSFETYAIHWPLMLTCEAGLFLVFEKHFNYNTATLLSFAITLVVIYILSFLFNRLIKRINKAIYNLQTKHLDTAKT
ncbi:MAG: acyltransferase [Clostridia bacterium]|nr:acyltransferase [Clostridia bacterium]